MATGWEPASWSGAGASASPLFSGMLGSHQHPLTSPITWTRRALNRLLGSGQPCLRRPGLPSNSMMQVINILIVPVMTSRNMNVISLDIFFKLVISYLFESIRLHFFESIRLLLLWKYSFAIFLKVFFCYYFESIRLHFFESIRLLLLWKYSFAIFLKVFVCYYFESIRLMSYYGHSELWTKNCYELLETVIWTAVRDLEGECVVVCVMNDVNKEL